MGVWQDGCVRFRTWNMSTLAALQRYRTDGLYRSLHILFCTPLTDLDGRYWPAFPLAPSCLEYPSCLFSLRVYLRLFGFAFFWTCGRPLQLPIPQMWVQLTVKWVLVSSRLLCSDESNLRLPSDSVGSVSSPTVDSTGQLPGRQLWLASKSQKNPFFSLHLLSLSVSSAHLFSKPIYSLLCLILSLHSSTTQPQGHMASVDLLAQHQPPCSLWGGWLFGGFVWTI